MGNPSTCGKFLLCYPEMMAWADTDISGLLLAWSRGDEDVLSDLMPLVYKDLRGIARHHLGPRSGRQIASSGTLVHEAYLKLVHGRGVRCQDRAHFYALCSQIIRHILVDHARKQGYAKRGGGQIQVPLDEHLLGSKARGIDVQALDEVLAALARFDPRKSRVVELRFFGGLSIEETAEVLEMSEETVTRDWRVAKAWLFRELAGRKAGG